MSPGWWRAPVAALLVCAGLDLVARIWGDPTATYAGIAIGVLAFVRQQELGRRLADLERRKER